jgi:hypothetical protein
VIVWEEDGRTFNTYYLDADDRLGATLPSLVKNKHQGYLLWDEVPAEIEDDEAEQEAEDKEKAEMVDEGEGDDPAAEPDEEIPAAQVEVAADEGDGAENGADRLGELQLGDGKADVGARDKQGPAGEAHKDEERKDEDEEDAKEKEEAEKDGGNQAQQQPTVMEDKCTEKEDSKGTEQCEHAGA